MAQRANALLAARDILDPIHQLSVNLAGEKGSSWLRALNKFNRKEPAWPPRRRTKTTVRLRRGYRLNPATFLGKGWSIAEEAEATSDLDEWDTENIQLDVSFLQDGETSVQGEEKRQRLLASGKTLLGADHFFHYLENQDQIPEEWKKVSAVYFDGTVLLNPSGCRYVLCLYWHGGQWPWDYVWLDDHWHAANPSAVL
jgi:hypothetical protein